MEPSIQNVGLRFGFAGLLVIAFFSLYCFAAVAPGAMAAPSLGGLPLSLVLATVMILFTVTITGLYVLIANKNAR
jgi:uncharacterized membrane protein (DUF485 family)